MKFLYIGLNRDIFSRHELGFIAALSSIGEINVLGLYAEKSFIGTINVDSDNGCNEIRIVNLKTNFSIFDLFRKIHKYVDVLNEAIDITNFDVIYATPRIPILIASILNKRFNAPVILRLWSIRAFKVPDYIRHGVYYDIFHIFPSFLANLSYITKSNKTIFLDDFTYKCAKKIYLLFKRRFYKIYPPCGFIISAKKGDLNVLEKLKELDEYVLGVTVLSKSRSYLRLEALPHAYIFYQVAKKNPGIPVVVIGSTRKEFILQVLKGHKELLPKNLVFLGKGFSDMILKQIYNKAKIVVHYNPFSSISNRFIEALYLGKAVIADKNLLKLYPELDKYKAISTVNAPHEYSHMTRRLYRNEREIEKLSYNAQRAYNELFSLQANLDHLLKLIQNDI